MYTINKKKNMFIFFIPSLFERIRGDMRLQSCNNNFFNPIPAGVGG